MRLNRRSTGVTSSPSAGTGIWVPDARQKGLVTAIQRAPGFLAAFLAWSLFAVIYLGLQASLPYVVGRIPAFFVILFATLLLGVVVFLAGSDKRWRFVLVIAFFLIMSGQLPVFFGGTRLNTRVIETLLRLALMAFVALDTLALRRRIWPPLWVLVIFVSHIVILTLSWVDAEYITEVYATREVILMHITGFVLFIAGYVYVRRWRHVTSFASVMVAGASAFSILGIFEYFAGENYYRMFLKAFPYMTERVYLAIVHHRVIGPFDNQVAFGSWLAMFVTIPLALKANETHFKRRLVWNTALVLIWLCLFFTGSRGPFLGAFAGYVTYSWLTGRIKKAFVVNTVAGLLVLVVVAYGARVARILPENNLILRFVDPTAAVRSGGDVFDTIRDARLEAWKDAIQEWRNRPILGIGPGEWVKRRMQVYEQGKVTTVSSFSPYVQYLVENGILGIGSLALLMLVLAVYNVRALASLRPGPRRDLIAALGVAGLVVHLVSLTDVGYGINRLFYFFWMSQGVLLMGTRIARAEEAKGEEHSGKLLQGWRPGWRAPASRVAVPVLGTGMAGQSGRSSCS